MNSSGPYLNLTYAEARRIADSKQLEWWVEARFMLEHAHNCEGSEPAHCYMTFVRYSVDVRGIVAGRGQIVTSMGNDKRSPRVIYGPSLQDGSDPLVIAIRIQRILASIGQPKRKHHGKPK